MQRRENLAAGSGIGRTTGIRSADARFETEVSNGGRDMGDADVDDMLICGPWDPAAPNVSLYRVYGPNGPVSDPGPADSPAEVSTVFLDMSDADVDDMLICGPWREALTNEDMLIYGPYDPAILNVSELCLNAPDNRSIFIYGPYDPAALNVIELCLNAPDNRSIFIYGPCDPAALNVSIPWLPDVPGFETRTVVNPRMLKFGGGQFSGDLNGDGCADIIMSITQDGHDACGMTGAWLIQEDRTAVWGDLGTRGENWEIFGTGLAAFDPRCVGGLNQRWTPDVYLKSSDNTVSVWYTLDVYRGDASVTVLEWRTIACFDRDTAVLGLGDFDGNGQTDLLLRNANGAVGCYLTKGEAAGWNYFRSLGDEWTIAAIGDLNGDGISDLVLQNDSGAVAGWLVQSDRTVTCTDLGAPAGFSVVGCGDFDGDGTDDVLLQNGSYFGAWLMQDGHATGWFGIGDLGDVTVEQVADFDGDGRDDLRMRTASGDLGAHLVRGADCTVWEYYGSVGAEWSTSLAAL